MLKLKINDDKLFYLDRQVLSVISSSCWLAGGSLRTCVDKEDEVADYDLFFPNSEAATKTKEALQELDFNVVFECPLGELTTMKQDDLKVQLVTKFYYKSIVECVESFDFNACCFGYDGEYLYTTKEAINAVKRKRLSFNQITFPVATINRMFKYRQKGYVPYEKDLVFLVREINEKQFDGSQLALYID